MSERPRGRARGRASARGRGGPASASLAEVRRPGSNTPPQVVPQAAAGENGNGRASLRGSAREHRPGAGVADLPVTGMRNMSLGTGDASARRRRGELSFVEPNTRPAHVVDKRGTTGNALTMATNYFRVIQTPGWALYQYHVSFNPVIDSKRLSKALLFDHQNMFGLATFDGNHLYTATRLHDEVTEVFSERRHDSATIKITIRRVAELSPNSPTCLHIFNILFRQILETLGLREVQRAYYNQAQRISMVNHRLEVWPGFKTSILQYEDSLMLNIDLSHKVLRTDTVLDKMYEIYQRRGAGSQFKSDCTKELVGQIVLTRYNDKTYRIDDIAWDVNPSHTFKRLENRDAPGRDRSQPRREIETTYEEYYRTAHHIDMRIDMEQPMLVSRPKRNDQREGAPQILYLLPQLCTRTGLTDDQRSNFNLMKDLAVHTKVDPTKRAATMREFMQQMRSNGAVQEKLRGWGLQFSEGNVEVKGRTLPAETIMIGNPRGKDPTEIKLGHQAEWNIRGPLYTTVPIRNWLVIYYEKNKDIVNDFLQTLETVRQGFTMVVGAATRVSLQNDSTGSFLEAIRANMSPGVQLVLCVLPSNKKDRYDAIKKMCCVETPVPSQCATINTLRKPKGLMSVVSKIAIQLTCKLGGEPWAVQIPMNGVMVIGYDTYHDGDKKKTGRSVGGLVCSLNRSFTRYYSQCSFHHTAEELCTHFTANIQMALKKYHEVNGKLPERIVLFRDGVGDGQLGAVAEIEVPQILKSFEFFGQDYAPKFAFIVVKKRVNSRFFTKGQNYANPPPGSIVDSVVTKPEWFDFFLISQSCRQGTVSPTHFNVIWDTSGLKPDHLQRLAYKLTHLYYNWPGTIRVPAPCQYAHKLAFLVGTSIHRAPDLSLADKLYYL